MALVPRGDCGSDPNWQPTVSAYMAANTDQELSSWWKNITLSPHTSFANELGRSFGNHVNSFECGIGDSSSCSMPDCSSELSFFNAMHVLSTSNNKQVIKMLVILYGRFKH
jgi:hypothetical protein